MYTIVCVCVCLCVCVNQALETKGQRFSEIQYTKESLIRQRQVSCPETFSWTNSALTSARERTRGRGGAYVGVRAEWAK